MSDARRTAEELAAAQTNVHHAANCAARYRYRGAAGTSLPRHVTDLNELVFAMQAIEALTKELAGIVKLFADDARARYVHGHTPEQGMWPDSVQQAGSDANQALSKLRSHFTRAPIGAAGNALAILHALLREFQRSTGTK